MPGQAAPGHGHRSQGKNGSQPPAAAASRQKTRSTGSVSWQRTGRQPQPADALVSNRLSTRELGYLSVIVKLLSWLAGAEVFATADLWVLTRL